MPALPRAQLTEVLLGALEEGGAAANLLSRADANPRVILCETAEQSVRVYVYLWTLTFGGRKALPNEYRIQMTGVRSPLRLYPDGLTVLVGYESSLQMFAGFDVHRHRQFTEGSPSVQVDIRTVRQAITDGLAFARKGNDEVSCGVRPDHLLNYILCSDAIHRYGKAPKEHGLFSAAARGVMLDAEVLASLTEPRRRIVEQVSRLSRSVRFRQMVLQAYDNRCAITGIQLKLVDAAHILPVGAPGSTDEVVNGIAISPTYHRAFDMGLIFLDESYHFRVSAGRVAELRAYKLDGGLPDFARALERTIILPANEQLRPSKEYIRKGNEFRRVC